MADGNGGPAIRIRDLRKSFGAQTVLNGIHLEVARSETLVVLGRSGTGKSVLLKILIGLQKPDSGSVRVDGEELASLSLDDLNRIRKRIGFLFQYAALYDSLTVEQNVEFPLVRHTSLSRKARRSRAMELLSKVGMTAAAGKLPSQISGGMRKRVGLARALALDPEIMLYDEPTAGLDPITSSEIDDLIIRLQEERKMSSVVVTHDLESAYVISDRVALLHEGNILFDGTLKELKTSDDPFVQAFIRRKAE
jgi:phospholipid/cholesterol/gamma-HCH transport system ATP-binding protein